MAIKSAIYVWHPGQYTNLNTTVELGTLNLELVDHYFVISVGWEFSVIGKEVVTLNTLVCMF